MARVDTLGHFLSDVAAAIRTAEGSSEEITASTFDTRIEALSGGGGDLSEYFVTEITSNQTSSTAFVSNMTKKFPDVTVANNVTQLKQICEYFKPVPKIICGNNVTNMQGMYQNCYATQIDVSGLDTSNVTNMQNMFNQCKATSLDLSNFDTSNVANMQSMFNNCTSLTSITLPTNFDLKDITTSVSVTFLFSGCSSLTSIDMQNFGKNGAWMDSTERMFYGCTALQHLDIRSMTFNRTTTSSSMFYNVPNGCEIIVKDNDAKTWITTNFSNLTNVKTVAEYEAEQNA